MTLNRLTLTFYTEGTWQQPQHHFSVDICTTTRTSNNFLIINPQDLCYQGYKNVKNNNK